MPKDPSRIATRAAFVLASLLAASCAGSPTSEHVAHAGSASHLVLRRAPRGSVPSWASSLLVPREISASGASLAYDPGRDQVVLFGGRSGRDLLTDTWVWSPGGFARRAPTASPSARMNAAMAFDPNRGRVLLFGGRNGDTVYADTWEWDGESWRAVTTDVAPPARSEAQMVYDAAHDRLVLFGGHTGRVRTAADANGRINTPIALGDTWTWDGQRWAELVAPPPEPEASADGGVADAGVAAPSGPSARAWFAMGYDPTLAKVVIFGGRDGFSNFLGDTWTHDGTRWTRVDVADAPPARTAAALVFDPSLGRLVLAAGVYAGTPPDSLADDAWTFDGTRWLPLDVTSRDHPRGAILGAYLAPHEHVAFFTVREANELDASTAAWLEDGSLTVVTATRSATASAPRGNPHELLADPEAQIERWLAISEDANALGARRESALNLAVDALTVAPPGVRRELGARTMTAVLASEQPANAFRLLATPREWLATEEDVEPILMELEALAEQRSVLCTPNVFARLSSGVRVRVHAHRLAPIEAVFTHDDVIDPRFTDTEVLRDALVLAVAHRNRAEAAELAARILGLDGFDGFALVADAALSADPTPAALDAVDAYYATVTGSHGTCLDVDAVAKLQRYAAAHPSDWTAFAIDSIGTSFDPSGSSWPRLEVRDVPVDRQGGLRTLRAIVRGMIRDHVLPRAVQDSPFFSEYEPDRRPAPRAAARAVPLACPGVTSTDRQRVLERTRSLAYDDPIAAFLDATTMSAYPARLCLARALGPESAPLFEGLEAVRYGAATRDEVLWALVDLDPEAFAPFARAVLRAARVDGLALSDEALVALRTFDAYTAARGLGTRFVVPAPVGVGEATLSARLLHALSLVGAGDLAAAAVELEALAPLSTEPNELDALAGIAYAFSNQATGPANAERLAVVLAERDSTSARSLAVRHALLAERPGPRPLDVYFEHGSPEPPREAFAHAVPLIGRTAPTRDCARRFDGARYEDTLDARTDALERVLDAAGLPAEVATDVGHLLSDETLEHPEALAAAVRAPSTPITLVCAMRQATEYQVVYLAGVSTALTVRTIATPCVGLPLDDEAAVRVVAYELRRPGGAASPLARLSEFVARTDGHAVDATNLDVLEARVLALGALGRDAEAAELRLALLAFSVRVPLDASAYRESGRLRATLEPLFGPSAYFGFVDGEADDTLRYAQRTPYRERLVAEVRSGVLTRESRIHLALSSTTMAGALAALEASPRSLVLARWGLEHLYLGTAGAERERLLALLREPLRRLAREAPLEISAYALSHLDGPRDRGLLREICRAVEARTLAEDPEYPEEAIAELVDEGYAICIGSFRTRVERDPSDDDEDY